MLYVALRYIALALVVKRPQGVKVMELSVT